MVENPTISIVMGVHNDKDYLSNSIDSILSQTFQDFEFIIVNDASTDGSRAILQQYDDNRITMLENETNKGLTASLNRAIGMATGEYIARQDADDESHPHRLERQLNFLRKKPEIALVGTGAHLIDEDGSKQGQRIVFQRPTFEHLLEKNHIIHGSILVRHSCLRKMGGYDEFFRYSQDLDLWLRLSKKYRLANISTPLYRLRIHDESVYFSQKDESALYALFAIHRASGDLSSSTEKQVRKRGIEVYYDMLTEYQQASFHRDLAIRYLRYNHIEQAREECIKALNCNPNSIKAVGLYLLTFVGTTPVRLFTKLARQYLNIKYNVINHICDSL